MGDLNNEILLYIDKFFIVFYWDVICYCYVLSKLIVVIECYIVRIFKWGG